MMLEEQQNKCMECRRKDVKIRKQKCCRINLKNLKPFSWKHTHTHTKFKQIKSRNKLLRLGIIIGI